MQNSEEDVSRYAVLAFRFIAILFGITFTIGALLATTLEKSLRDCVAGAFLNSTMSFYLAIHFSGIAYFLCLIKHR